MRAFSEQGTPAKRLYDGGYAQELASLPPQGLFKGECSDTHLCNGTAVDEDAPRKRSLPADELTEERAAKRAESLEPAGSRADSPFDEQRVVARALFGPGATTEELEAYFQQAGNKARQEFKERWNFDPTTEQPVAEPGARWHWQAVERGAREGACIPQPSRSLAEEVEPVSNGCTK